ncbi:MAG: hypothetical protein R3C16_01960 [Hyphomonadaceae bacterium]
MQAALKRLETKAAIITAEDERAVSGSVNSKWFDDLEKSHDAVFLVTPIADTPWFRTCLRQADRLWFFARADAPSLPILPPEEPSPARQFKLVDVILLHHGMDRKAASTNSGASPAMRRDCSTGADLKIMTQPGWRASLHAARSGLCFQAAARAPTRISAWCARCARRGCHSM